MFSGMTSFLFGSAPGDVTVDQTQESQQAELNTMDAELGWVLVDTRASGGVVQLEESPLENLLIEHPSMSVYHAHQGTESTSDEENIMAVLPASAHRQDIQQTHRRPHILTAHGNMELCKLSRFHQRQQTKSLNKQLNRKCTERSNKTCYQNSCKKRGSQRNRILRPSGCKSGRRGQRAV